MNVPIQRGVVAFVAYGGALIAIGMVYVLSSGPAIWWASLPKPPHTQLRLWPSLMFRQTDREPRLDVIQRFYSPLLWLDRHSATYASAWGGYLDLWEPRANRH